MLVFQEKLSLSALERDVVNKILSDIAFLKNHDNVRPWTGKYFIPENVNKDKIVKVVKRIFERHNIRHPVTINADGELVCVYPPWEPKSKAAKVKKNLWQSGRCASLQRSWSEGDLRVGKTTIERV